MNNEEFQKTVLEQLESNKQFQENVTEFQKTVTDQLVRLAQEVTEVRLSQTRIENDYGKKIDALFDAREVQNDVTERIFEEFKQLNDKIDKVNSDALLKRIK